MIFPCMELFLVIFQVFHVGTLNFRDIQIDTKSNWMEGRNFNN